MGLRKILTDKDPALHKVCKPMVNFDDRLFRLLEDMKETLIDSGGVGLAAPQVGILRRVVLVDTGEEILELINPTLVAVDGEQTGAEGCLSVRNLRANVARPEFVKARLPQLDGSVLEIDCGGLLARCLQHECDHLDGFLYVDRVSSAAKITLAKKLKKLASMR